MSRGPFPRHLRSPPGMTVKQVPGTGAAIAARLWSALLSSWSKHLIEAQVITQNVLLQAECLIILYIIVNGKLCPNV